MSSEYVQLHDRTCRKGTTLHKRVKRHTMPQVLWRSGQLLEFLSVQPLPQEGFASGSAQAASAASAVAARALAVLAVLAAHAAPGRMPSRTRETHCLDVGELYCDLQRFALFERTKEVFSLE